MYKAIVIYKVPADIKTFEQYYSEIHLPLAKKVPHLKEFRVSKVFGTPAGKSDLHVIAEMCFENKSDFDGAMKSPEMTVTGKDTRNFAKDIISIHFAEEKLI